VRTGAISSAYSFVSPVCYCDIPGCAGPTNDSPPERTEATAFQRSEVVSRVAVCTSGFNVSHNLLTVLDVYPFAGVLPPGGSGIFLIWKVPLEKSGTASFVISSCFLMVE